MKTRAIRLTLPAAIFLAVPALLHAQTAAEIERMLDESSDEHMREELGVNEITTPSIREILQELEQFRPIPLDLIATNQRDATFSNRLQTSLHIGSLVADGFMLTIAERSQDVQDIGRALIRQAHSLGVGDQLLRRSKSILEKSDRGDWLGMREELIGTQVDVEESMMELRDEEMAHLISLGGYLRGFQIATHATAENYFPPRARELINIEVMDYFLARLDTLHPRLKKTEMVTVLVSRLETLRALAASTEGRSPTEQEVLQMRALADELNAVATARVDEEGRIVGALP